MIRIIDGTAYIGKPADWVKLKAFDLGNGHLEVMAHRPTVWVEQDWSDFAVAQAKEAMDRCRAERDAVEHQQLMARKAAHRAKKRVRQLCKVMGVDTLLTLTYRANEGDLARCKSDLKEFVRRLRRVVPGFRAVCGFEQQERGAWHVHMACNRFDKEFSWQGAKVKSFNVIRAVWRSVTGERAGTINVQSRKRNSERSPAKIAAYIAKYITKDYVDGEKWSNRWTKFGEERLPEPVDLGTFNDMREALVAAFDLMANGQVVANCRMSRWADSFFLFAERPPDTMYSGVK